MLEEVRITGLGVIDDAVLELSAGFTALTGETGRKLKHRIVDDAEAGDPDFLKHARLRPPTYGRASPPRAGRTWPPAGP